jgi:hypothetical protein
MKNLLMKTSSIATSKITALCLTGFLLTSPLCKAFSPAPGGDNYASLRAALSEMAGPSFTVPTPPAGGVVVAPGIASSVLLKPANSSSDVLLRVTSGPLRGSIVTGEYSDNKMVFIKIQNIKTPYGTDVWMPVTRGCGMNGVVEMPRVQVDRSEWTAVKGGGTLSAGTVVHLRILNQVQFDAPSGASTTLRLADR